MGQAFWLIMGVIYVVIGIRSVRDPAYRERTARRGARTDEVLRHVPLIGRLTRHQWMRPPSADGWLLWGWALLSLGLVILVAQAVDLMLGGAK